MIFQFTKLPHRLSYMKQLSQSAQASSCSLMTLGAVRSVTFLTAVTPLRDLPHSPKRIRLLSSTGVIQSCDSLPSAVQGYWYAYMQTHKRVCTPNTPFLFWSHSQLLFENISSFHAATYASGMFASDIQISSTAKCATVGLSWPILGGCTFVFNNQPPSNTRQTAQRHNNSQL